jgi:hypothetical protein
VVVDGRHRPRRHDEAEERERPVCSAEEKPLPDAAAHPALGRRLLVALRQPGPVGEELAERRLDRRAVLGRGSMLVDTAADLADELAHERRVEDVLVVLERRKPMLEVAHGLAIVAP